MSSRSILFSFITALLLASIGGYVIFRFLESGQGESAKTVKREAEAAKGSESSATSRIDSRNATEVSRALAGRGGSTPKRPKNRATSRSTHRKVKSSSSVSSVKKPNSAVQTSSLLVTVQNDQHEPVSDLEVRLSDGHTERTRKTSETGAAKFSGVPAASYLIMVTPEGESSLQSQHRVTLSPGGTHESLVIVPIFDATITGRVLDSSGTPVEGIQVLATPLSPGTGDTLLLRSETRTPTITDANGTFELTDLASREYTVYTEEQEGLSVARSHVTAPSSGIDLVVKAAKQIVITGEVTDTNGDPIAGAIISTLSHPAQVVTERDGSYVFDLEIVASQKSTLPLFAKHKLYKPGSEEVVIDGDEDVVEIEVSFELQPPGDLGDLTGRLFDPDTSPVVGEKVYLRSSKLNLQYTAVSDTKGEFVMEDVVTSSDYRLWIYPKQTYRDVVMRDLEIETGDNPVDIELEPFDVGDVDLVLVDGVGVPIDGFMLRLRSANARSHMVSSTTDNNGHVHIENVPAGAVIVDTRTFPRLNAVGITAIEGEEVKAEIPVGIGDRTISGRVSETGGVVERTDKVVAGARVVVTWRGQRGNVNSRLFQEAITDADGYFSVDGFGPGSVEVSVSATGYRPRRKHAPDGDKDVTDLDIALQPFPQKK